MRPCSTINIKEYERGLMDTGCFKAQEGRLEEGLRSTESIREFQRQFFQHSNTCEPFITDGDDLTIGKLVALLQG